MQRGRNYGRDAGRNLRSIPAHWRNGACRLLHIVGKRAVNDAGQSSAFPVRDPEGESVVAAGGASALANFQQHFVPARAQFDRDAISPVVVHLVPEGVAEASEDLLVVQPHLDAIVGRDHEISLLVLGRKEISEGVARDPLVPRRIQDAVELDDVSGVVEGPAFRQHPDVPVCQGQVRLVAVIALPAHQSAVQAWVLLIQMDSRVRGNDGTGHGTRRAERLFGRVGRIESRIIRVGERADDVPVAHRTLRLAQPEGWPGRVVERGVRPSELFPFAFRGVFDLHIRNFHPLRLGAKLPIPGKRNGIEVRHRTERPIDLAVSAHSDFEVGLGGGRRDACLDGVWLATNNLEAFRVGADEFGFLPLPFERIENYVVSVPGRKIQPHFGSLRTVHVEQGRRLAGQRIPFFGYACDGEQNLIGSEPVGVVDCPVVVPSHLFTVFKVEAARGA